MASLKRLDNLYPTMTDLAIYLMLAHEKHARYILCQPDNQPLATVEVTYEYVRALLACGIPPESQRVQEAVAWFSAPRPADALDRAELLRLEALLHLAPDSPGVQPRLERLLGYREHNGLFQVERNSMLSDTLAALRIMLLARDLRLLDGHISDAEIEQIIDKLRDMLSDDSDLALLLRLKHRLTNKLDSDLLKHLLDQARSQNGVWGIRRQYASSRIVGTVQAMHIRQLSGADIGSLEDGFSEIMLDTCIVIEELVRMASDLKPVLSVLETSMALWWNQIQGDKAPARLRALFPNELIYLRVLCRTVSAVSAYSGELVAKHLLEHALAAGAGRFKDVEWAEKTDIETALRHWIGVDLPEEEVVRLKLGLSDSNVVRITPRLYHPISESQMNPRDETLIVKYGPIDEVDNERASYNALPAAMRRFFVKIPNKTHTNERRQAFVIMEDLSGYFTLYEICKDLMIQDNTHLSSQLSSFLIEMHRSAGDTGIATSVHFHELYIRPMLEQVDFIFARVQDLERGGLLPQDNFNFDGHSVLYDHLSDQLAAILTHQRKLERFPTAFMHGDLHSRNIMVRWDRSARRSADRFDFKLIDLSNLRRDGDIAHDAGQIVVDLGTLPLRGDFKDSRVAEGLEDLEKRLENVYSDYAYERAGDDTFSIRLNLSKARALIRIAKSLSKQGGKALAMQAHSEAIGHLSTSLSFAQWAAEELESVCNDLI